MITEVGTSRRRLDQPPICTVLRAHRPRINTAERAQEVTRVLPAGRGDADLVEDAVVAVVDNRRTIRRINALTIDIVEIITDWEVDGAIHRRTVDLL